MLYTLMLPFQLYLTAAIPIQTIQKPCLSLKGCAWFLVPRELGEHYPRVKVRETFDCRCRLISAHYFDDKADLVSFDILTTAVSISDIHFTEGLRERKTKKKYG